MKPYKLLIATLSIFGGLAQAAQVDYVVAKKQENEKLQEVKRAVDKNDEALTVPQGEFILLEVLPVVLHQLIKDYCFNYRGDFFAALYQSIPLIGHTTHIRVAAMTPDCGTIVTGCGAGEKMAKVWNGDGVCIASLDNHAGFITAVAVTLDGNYVVTGSWLGDVRVWDKARNQVDKLVGHTDDITSVTITPDGNIIVTGSADKTAKIWDRKTGKCLFTLSGHEGCVGQIVISVDGSAIVTRDTRLIRVSGTAKIWDATGNHLRTLVHEDDDIRSMAITANGDTIVTAGTADHIVKVWKTATGECIKILQHDDWVLNAVLNSEGNKLTTVSINRNNDKIISVWDIASGACIEKFNVPVTHCFTGVDALLTSSLYTKNIAIVRKTNQQIRQQLSKLSLAQLMNLKQLLTTLNQSQEVAKEVAKVAHKAVTSIILSQQQGAALFALPLEYQCNICAHYFITETAEAFNKRMEQDCKKMTEQSLLT